MSQKLEIAEAQELLGTLARPVAASAQSPIRRNEPARKVRLASGAGHSEAQVTILNGDIYFQR
jgi:hypothetical protein